MGYTHYWYRQKQIEQSTFDAIRKDFEQIVIALDDAGVRLADGLGENVPVITSDEIYFNGYSHCGHKRDESIVIPWPAPKAQGVMQGEGAAGSWFAGTLLDTRVCNGDCSYETFSFPRKFERDKFLQESDDHRGLFFECCKTAYRPYDLAVTAFLIIAKHHLDRMIHVSSDGADEQWNDAKRLCQAFLGYGSDYLMTNDGLQAGL